MPPAVVPWRRRPAHPGDHRQSAAVAGYAPARRCRRSHATRQIVSSAETAARGCRTRRLAVIMPPALHTARQAAPPSAEEGAGVPMLLLFQSSSSHAGRMALQFSTNASHLPPLAETQGRPFLKYTRMPMPPTQQVWRHMPSRREHVFRRIQNPPSSRKWSRQRLFSSISW